MDASFYRAFEDRFRGTRETILARLQFYVPTMRIWANHIESPKALDLGCGRGEWLEVLVSAGFDPMGYDLDDGMLDACRERGLPAAKGDAIEKLKAQPDNSLAVVSGFHIIEHLPLELFSTVFEEAHRALAPGGLLILETPNPENLQVASWSFYLDPTHVKPIPPPLLWFFADHYGFSRTCIVRLQENPDLLSGEVGLSSVLFGASPDYAIVAQKQGTESFVNQFNEFFETPKGVSTQELAQRFDDSIAMKRDIQITTEKLMTLTEKLRADLRQLGSEVQWINNSHRLLRMLAHDVRDFGRKLRGK